MADRLAGTTVLEEPATVSAEDSTTITGQGVGDTDWEPLSTEVSVTIIAPDTGRVEITIGAGMRISAGTGRAWAEPELREDDVNGTIVFSPTVSANSNRRFGTPAGASDYVYGGRTSLATGLTPFATYFARVMTSASTNATEYDVFSRSIMVRPA